MTTAAQHNISSRDWPAWEEWMRRRWMAGIPAELRRPADGGRWMSDNLGARQRAKAKAEREARKARIEALQAQGADLDEIAAAIGLNRHGLLRFMRSNGITSMLPDPAAERRALAPEVMRLRDQGLTHSKIAAALGLSRTRVGVIIREAQE